jgi:hypothetical protein
MQDDLFLDTRILAGTNRDSSPLVLPWPLQGNPCVFLSFSSPTEWQRFISSLSLPPGIPEIVAAKFRRAQMLYFLAWHYPDQIKAGELFALVTLELALNDQYGRAARIKAGNKLMKKSKVKPKFKAKGSDDYMPFANLLRQLLEDGLTDNKIPVVRRSGGSVVGFLDGTCQPSLAEMRNSLAHGEPFDGFPRAGLLELVRDLIQYAYRESIRLAGG